MSSHHPRDDAADVLAVQDVLLEYGRRADRRDWEALMALLTDPVEVDYGGPEVLPARELVLGRWAPLFTALDATQHLTGPASVTLAGDVARATAYFQATHVMSGADGGDVWTLGGRYDARLVRDGPRWRIAELTMSPIWQTGNTDLMTRAAERAAATDDDGGLRA